MANDDFTEPDVMWAAINGAFSPEQAICFRNYLLPVENSVREADYFIFHRSGTVAILLIEPAQQGQLVREPLDIEGGISVRDEFSDEVRTHYPAMIARSFLVALRRKDLPIMQEVTIIWLPNISGNTDLSHYQPNDLVPETVVTLLGNIITTHSIRGIFDRLSMYSDRAGISDEEWLRIKARLNPPSLIQSKPPRPDRNDQQLAAEKLSEIYVQKYHKSTPIFISYRRDDAGWPAGRIYGDLTHIFRRNIFFDYDSIKPGTNWIDAIDQALDDCIVQLVIMGPKWATFKRPGARTTRILEHKDMVAHEIRTALRKKVVTIPLLIDHNRMPNVHELPNGLKGLVTRNAMLLNQDNYFAKFDILVDNIVDLLDLALHP